MHIIPKKVEVIEIVNENGQEIQTHLPTKWQVCIDYPKLNVTTKKDHFPLRFINEILDRLVGQSYFCFLDGYSGYNQIIIHLNNQEKTMFTCFFGTFPLRQMSFRLRNAPTTFHRSMIAIFSDFLDDNHEVLIDDFSIFGDDF